MIISPGAIVRNSALGWWGAYLMESSLSSSAVGVIVPSEWVSEDSYGLLQHRVVEDLYPPDWTVI